MRTSRRALGAETTPAETGISWVLGGGTTSEMLPISGYVLKVVSIVLLVKDDRVGTRKMDRKSGLEAKVQGTTDAENKDQQAWKKKVLAL